MKTKEGIYCPCGGESLRESDFEDKESKKSLKKKRN